MQAFIFVSVSNFATSSDPSKH